MAVRPKATVAAHIIAGIATVVAVGVMTLLLGRLSAFYFFGDDDWGPLVALLLIVALGAFLVYRNALRIAMLMPWSRLSRRDPRVEVPGELVIACLRGVDFSCAGCGYNLRSLDRAACPECNRTVRLAFTDAETRPMAVGFFLTLSWLLITLAANVLTGYSMLKVLTQMLSSPWMAGGGMSGPYGWYVVIYGGAIAAACGVIVACVVRLWRLRTVGTDVGSRWTHSTLVTLIVVNIVWLSVSSSQWILAMIYM